MDGRSTSDADSAERFVSSARHLSCSCSSAVSSQVKSIYRDNSEAASVLSPATLGSRHFGSVLRSARGFERWSPADRLRSAVNCLVITLRGEIRELKEADMGVESHTYIFIWAANCFVCSSPCRVCVCEYNFAVLWVFAQLITEDQCGRDKLIY